MAKRSLVLIGILIGVLVTSAGFLSVQYFLPAAKNENKDSIGLSGYAVINAYHANGALFATWQGHNSITPNGLNSIDVCMSGQHLPPFFNSCTGPIKYVFVDDGGANLFRGAATNALVPSGCNPNANPGTCTGWQSRGSINCSSGAFPVTLIHAGTEDSNPAAFDSVNISPIVVNQGDFLTVTITFTVS